MADIADCANAIVNMLGTALYPNGVNAGSPVGVNFRIYRGHPGPDKLDIDMQAGFSQVGGVWTLTAPTARIVHCCVNSRPGVGRLVRPYVISGAQQTGTPPTQTLTVAVSGSTVTIGGTIGAGLGVAVSANGVCAGAAAGSTDTLTTLATAVAAALVTAGATASASGAVITLTNGLPLYANTFELIATGQEVERQIQGFEITLYVPGRDLRDTVSAAIKPALAATQQITLPDNFQALMRSAPPIELDDDKPEKALLFIRRIFLQIEYATVVAGQAATQAIAQAVMADFIGNTLPTVVES